MIARRHHRRPAPKNIVGPLRPERRAQRSPTGVALRTRSWLQMCRRPGSAPPALDARAAGRHRTVFVSTCPHGRSAKKPADSRFSGIRASIGMENAESGSGFKVTRHDRFPGCEQHGDRPEHADCRTDSVPDQEQRHHPRRGRGVHPGASWSCRCPRSCSTCCWSSTSPSPWSSCWSPCTSSGPWSCRRFRPSCCSRRSSGCP